MNADAGLSSEISQVMPALRISTVTMSWIWLITIVLDVADLLQHPLPQAADALLATITWTTSKPLITRSSACGGIFRAIRALMASQVRPRIDRTSLTTPLRSHFSGSVDAAGGQGAEQPALQPGSEVGLDAGGEARGCRP